MTFLLAEAKHVRFDGANLHRTRSSSHINRDQRGPFLIASVPLRYRFLFMVAYANQNGPLTELHLAYPRTASYTVKSRNILH